MKMPPVEIILFVQHLALQAGSLVCGGCGT
jgi:hypothetical protein